MKPLKNQLLTLQRLQEITKGRWLSEPANLQETLWGAAFDSRDLGAEGQGAEAFYTFQTEQADGHDYIWKLKNTSIKVAIVTKKDAEPIEGVAMLLVRDSLKALHTAAKEVAGNFQGKIVNITGSSGKTTAKTWLESMLRPYLKLVTNQKSFNNHIGCPVTILQVKEDTELLVLEMGTNGKGELDLLSAMAPADVTLLLNVGHAHVGKFGGLDKTYQAKLEIFNHMRQDALALIPSWDATIQEGVMEKWSASRADGEKKFQFKTFGLEASANARVTKITPLALGQKITFRYKGKEQEVEVDQVGGYVGQTLAALILILDALALLLPAATGWEEIFSEKLSLPQEQGRSTLLEGKQGVTLLDDTYNANPESVVNMLGTLASLPGEEYIAVIGNLGEMDAGMKDSAEVIVGNIPENLSQIFLTGETGKILLPLLQQANPGLQVTWKERLPYLIEDLQGLIQQKAAEKKQNGAKGLNIGVKGSRAGHMERVIFALAGADAPIKVRCNLETCPLLMNCKDCPKLTR